MSMPALLHEETYLPTNDHGEVGRVLDFLLKDGGDHADATPRYSLVGATSDERVELPVELFRVLRQVVSALQQNHAVTVAPMTTLLTTQQAADLLGVSRPTVIKLLDRGQIPYERPAAHRRIQLGDLLAYREARRTAQYDALAATTAADMDEADVEETLAELRAARREVAKRRRARRTS